MKPDGDRSLDNPREIRPELEAAVRHYLAEHPEAMDTAEGIAEWWLMQERIRVDVEALIRTLQRLTDQGVLEKIGIGDGARYRLKSSD
jgi:Fe2+ or Zn2+ uptake regulation protein